ncbi:MAG TPA: hypothetical protein VJ603_01335, partial [Paucimonas sp.]|nr:hypothetical protein [Paucimonas sp.]
VEAGFAQCASRNGPATFSHSPCMNCAQILVPVSLLRHVYHGAGAAAAHALIATASAKDQYPVFIASRKLSS